MTRTNEAASVAQGLTDANIRDIWHRTQWPADDIESKAIAFARALLTQAAPPAAPVQGDALRAALQRLEVACDRRSRLLTADAYNAASALPGMTDALLELDEARKEARALLAAPAAPATGESGAEKADPTIQPNDEGLDGVDHGRHFSGGNQELPSETMARIRAASAQQDNEPRCGVCGAKTTDPWLDHRGCQQLASAQQDEREALSEPTGVAAAIHQVSGALELCEPEDAAAFEVIVAALNYLAAQVQAGGEDKRPQTAAARDVLAERRRQVEAEGWTPEHDDVHANFDMAYAAACYAMADDWTEEEGTPEHWPWAPHWWKPKSARQNLVRAGALILAEIERRDRAAMSREHLNNEQGESK